MTYTQIEIITINREQTDILIAQLANIGFEGFEEVENGLKAFINKEQFCKEDVEEIIATHHLTYTTNEIEQQNWNAQWESSFSPVIVDDFAAVRANFHAPITNVRHEIIITPKMSFGTGHHATTYLMIQQMAKIDFVGKDVFDFGTGTGVLAILAEKLGAKKVDAIDNDEWSIENCDENLKENSCKKVKVSLHNKIETNGKYDIVLANINLNVITASLPQIISICKPQAYILLSGFLVDDEQTISMEVTKYQLSIITRVQKNNWLCLVCKYDE